MTIEISTDRLYIRTVQESDAEKLLQFELKNQKHWMPYATNAFQDSATVSYWQKKLKEFALEFLNNQAFRFLLFQKSHASSDIIGMCNFTQIFRGPFQACYLGYKIDREFEGKGLMSEALTKLISYMFEVQNLHRIMANFVPSNKRSEKLLSKLGFQKEGYAKEYLFINEKWEDHVLTSLHNQNWKSERASLSIQQTDS